MVPEKPDNVIEVEQLLAASHLKQLMIDEPDVIAELEAPDDNPDEYLGGSDEDPDVPAEKIDTDYRGVESRRKVDRYGARITTKTPRKIPYFTNAQWGKLPALQAKEMLDDYDRRQRKKRIRGARGDWARLTTDQKLEVQLHFEKLREEQRSLMEAAMPAPDDDWGIGICDLNIELIEFQLRTFEKGEKPSKLKREDCAIAAENPAAGKARGRNRWAKSTRQRRMVPRMPCLSRVTGELGHRQRISPTYNLHDLGIPAMVARPVSKDEIKKDAKNECSKAVKAEWDKLKLKGVFDFGTVRAWKEAAQDARRNGRTEHMGRAFGIMVEKTMSCL